MPSPSAIHTQLTDAKVAKLSFNPFAEIFARDTNLRGFGLSISPRNVKSFVAALQEKIARLRTLQDLVHKGRSTPISLVEVDVVGDEHARVVARQAASLAPRAQLARRVIQAGDRQSRALGPG